MVPEAPNTGNTFENDPNREAHAAIEHQQGTSSPTFEEVDAELLVAGWRLGSFTVNQEATADSPQTLRQIIPVVLEKMYDDEEDDMLPLEELDLPAARRRLARLAEARGYEEQGDLTELQRVNDYVIQLEEQNRNKNQPESRP